jgi:hypothetical protein
MDPMGEARTFALSLFAVPGIFDDGFGFIG